MNCLYVFAFQFSLLAMSVSGFQSVHHSSFLVKCARRVQHAARMESYRSLNRWPVQTRVGAAELTSTQCHFKNGSEERIGGRIQNDAVSL